LNVGVLSQRAFLRQELKVLQDEVRSLKSEVGKKAVAAQPQAKKAGPIKIADSPTIGDKKAQIAVIEFSDYQCPYCRRHFQQTLPEIEKNYIDTGKVKYVMKQFPLGFHAKAKGASIAALCMDKIKPGSYWKAHKAIFNGETKLESSAYLALAKSLKIKQSRYEKCVDDPAMAKVVDTDMAQGESVGVSGTPAFLVGKIVNGEVVDGRLITGARPYSSFSNAIDQLL